MTPTNDKCVPETSVASAHAGKNKAHNNNCSSGCLKWADGPTVIYKTGNDIHTMDHNSCILCAWYIPYVHCTHTRTNKSLWQSVNVISCHKYFSPGRRVATRHSHSLDSPLVPRREGAGASEAGSRGPGHALLRGTFGTITAHTACGGFAHILYFQALLARF